MQDKATIGVVGAGLMGHGIAWIFAAAGHRVQVWDPSGEAMAALPDRLGDIDALLGQARLSEVTPMTDAAQVAAGAAVVFEAAPEELALKQALFAELEAAAPTECLFASNTSAIPIGRLSERMRDRTRLVGTHFWNPPHLVPLVEVTETTHGNRAGVDALIALLREVGRHPVHVRRDVPGFIGNRLQHALKREAIALVASGVADAATVDEVAKLGFGSRLAVLGPLEQTDLVGLDLTESIHSTLMPDIDTTAEPHPLLRQKVAEGKLGMNSGEGFYRWTPHSAQALRDRLASFLVGLATSRKAPPKE